MNTPYHVTRLDNSLLVATAEMPSMKSVALGVWVAVGGRHEPARICGVSHFIEHMLFKGTRRRSAKQISQDVEGIGGSFDAGTDVDHTCYVTQASADKLDLVLDVLMDMYLESRFDAAELEKERDVIKKEIQMYLDQPSEHAQEILNEVLWPKQPLGRSLTGTFKSMDAISRRDILDYKAQHYVGSNTIIVAAGQVEHARLLEMVRPLAKRIREGRKHRFLPARMGGHGPVVRLLTKETEQSHLALGLHSFSRTDERRYALRLLNVMFGGNMSSRLFQVVREQHGLAYYIHSSFRSFADTGAMIISAGLDNKGLTKALRLTVREMARAVAKPPSAGELRRAKDYIVGQTRLAQERPSVQMSWAAADLLRFGKIIDPDDVVNRIQQVTASEVQAVARELFRTSRLRLAVIGPTKDAKAIEQELKRL